MERLSPFNRQQLEAFAKILADTATGLTGSQIGYLLQDARIPDVSPQMTKWKRLFNAFVECQNEREYGNHVLMFVNRAMDPVNYTDSPEVFVSRQSQLNSALAFCGMAVGNDGKVRRTRKAVRAVSTPLRQPDSAFTVAPQAGDERGRAIVTDGL